MFKDYLWAMFLVILCFVAILFIGSGYARIKLESPQKRDYVPWELPQDGLKAEEIMENEEEILRAMDYFMKQRRDPFKEKKLIIVTRGKMG